MGISSALQKAVQWRCKMGCSKPPHFLALIRKIRPKSLRLAALSEKVRIAASHCNISHWALRDLNPRPPSV
jgi:hypothetical protein